MGLSEDTILFLIMCGVTLLALAHPLVMWCSYLFTGTTIKKPPYREKSYWDQRYTSHPDAYEWLASYTDLVAAGFLGKQVIRAALSDNSSFSRWNGLMAFVHRFADS